MFKNKRWDKGSLTAIDMKMGKYKALYIAIIAILVIWCAVICLYPVVWLLLSGFKDVKEMYALPPTFFPKNFDLGKLGRVWTEMKLYKYYANTFILAGGCAIFNMVFSGFAGYAISKARPIGTKAIFMILFWIMLLPGTMRTVPIYMTIKDFPYLHINMLDSYFPMWIMAVNAFDIILFKNFFDGISDSLVEAARIDGASNLKIITKIMIPLSIPVICVVGIFTFNGNIGNFFMPLLLISDDSKKVLAVQIYNMKRGTYSMDYQMLAIFFSMIPQAIIFIIFQKQIMGGINIGGVKG